MTSSSYKEVGEMGMVGMVRHPFTHITEYNHEIHLTPLGTPPSPLPPPGLAVRGSNKTEIAIQIQRSKSL